MQFQLKFLQLWKLASDVSIGLLHGNFSLQVLQDCTGDEFVIFMKLLSSLKHMQTMQGRTQLIEIVAEQSEMDKELQVTPR